MEISRKYIFPMQAIVIAMFAMQALLVFIVLYLRDRFWSDSFSFNLSDATSFLGWIMLIVIVVFSIWNLAVLFSRSRQLKKEENEEQRKQIFKSSLYNRYITLYAISFAGIGFCLIGGNLYFLIFTVISIFWQVGIFPGKNIVEAKLNAGLQPKVVEEKKDSQVVETKEQTLEQQETEVKSDN